MLDPNSLDYHDLIEKLNPGPWRRGGDNAHVPLGFNAEYVLDDLVVTLGITELVPGTFECIEGVREILRELGYYSYLSDEDVKYKALTSEWIKQASK